MSTSGKPAHEVLPAAHLVISLVKRWLMGTMQGSVSPEHLQAYFDEWVFRFNRRHSRHRGLPFYRLISQAVDSGPVTYADLRKSGRTRPAPTVPHLYTPSHRASILAKTACHGEARKHTTQPRYLNRYPSSLLISPSLKGTTMF